MIVKLFFYFFFFCSCFFSSSSSLTHPFPSPHLHIAPRRWGKLCFYSHRTSTLESVFKFIVKLKFPYSHASGPMEIMLAIYFGFELGPTICWLIAGTSVAVGTTIAANLIHNQILFRVLHYPMSFFYSVRRKRGV